MKTIRWAFILLFFIGSAQVLFGAVYSTVGDAGSINAVDLTTDSSKVIPASYMGLTKNDDIDALSLGDDTTVFGNKRVDIFSVNLGSKGKEGDLNKRYNYGLPISYDIYRESKSYNNKLLISNLSNGRTIDGFDFGDVYDFENNTTLPKWIYFSLKAGSETLANFSATQGDIFAVQIGSPNTLRLLTPKTSFGSPDEIDALSLHIENITNGYNPSTDYIIYSSNSKNIMHYGYSEPSTHIAHTISDFGLLDNDEVFSLEHKICDCPPPCLHIVNGWKLYGIDQGIDDVAKIFENKNNSIRSVWAYDEDSKTWKFYSPDSSLMASAESSGNLGFISKIRESEGFWIKGLEDKNICLDSSEGQTSINITFSETSNMNTDRMMHWIIPLENNNAVVIGGHGDGFVALNSAEIFNYDANSFSEIQMNATHDIGCFVKLKNGNYLVAGGADNLGVAPGNNKIETYNPKTNSFVSSGTMNYPRTGNAAAVLNDGRVVIAGGWYNDDSTSKIELFNPDTNISKNVGTLSTPRSYPWILPTDDNKAVVFWGMPPYGGTSIQSVELFNPDTNSSSKISDLILGEDGWAPLTQHLNRPLFLQKMNNNKYLLWAHKGDVTSLITFDPDSKKFEKFETTPNLPNLSDSLIVDVLVNKDKNSAFAIGIKTVGDTRTMEIYGIDLSTSLMKKLDKEYVLPANFHIGAYSANTILSGGNILITGGYSQTGSQTNFTPINKTLLIKF